MRTIQLCHLSEPGDSNPCVTGRDAMQALVWARVHGSAAVTQILGLDADSTGRALYSGPLRTLRCIGELTSQMRPPDAHIASPEEQHGSSWL